MKLAQIYQPGNGCQLVRVQDEKLYPVVNEEHGLNTLLDFVRYAQEEEHDLMNLIRKDCSEYPLPRTWSELNVTPNRTRSHVTLPIHPPEVWACGVTYKKSAEFRDEDSGTSKGIYDQVYFSKRPELFFKGTDQRCTGPNDFIGIRRDSKFTAVEPELAVLLNSRRQIIGFMASNDVSAWDIERENPLYLPQSKIFSGCCSLGPVLMTTESIPDPYSLSIQCEIQRGEELIFRGETQLSMMKRSIDELIEWLFYANSVPDGTVLLTGTGIIQTEDAALKEGDIVKITIPEIGTLTNTAKFVGTTLSSGK